MRIFFVALLIIFGFEILISKIISYPPNQEQLSLILGLPFGNYVFSFWVVKLASLAAVLAAVIIFWKMVLTAFGQKVAVLAGVLFAISPTSYAIWNLHPRDSLKAVVVMFFCFLVLTIRSGKAAAVGMGLIFLALVLLSNNQPFANIPILTAFKPSVAEDEIKDRLNSQEAIVSPIHIPLAVKRIAYNKPFFIYKNVLNTAISYGDLEAVFFQEVNNLGEKSFVIFYWPEFVLFGLGLFWWARGEVKGKKTLVALLTSVAFVDFVLLNKQPYQQFFLSMFPLSILVSLGAVNLGKYRLIAAIVSLALGYAFLVNYFDMAARPPYWFDNRPLVYQFIFDQVRKHQSQSQQIKVSTLIGNPDLYCRYYLGSCPPPRYEFDSFDLNGQPARGGVLYAGFVGEYIGKALENATPTDWRDKFPRQGLSILEFYETRDTIAYHYGDTVVVAIAK